MAVCRQGKANLCVVPTWRGWEGELVTAAAMHRHSAARRCSRSPACCVPTTHFTSSLGWNEPSSAFLFPSSVSLRKSRRTPVADLPHPAARSGSSCERSLRTDSPQNSISRGGTKRLFARFNSGFGSVASLVFVTVACLSVLSVPTTAAETSEQSDRRCAAFSHLTIPFFFLDKEVTYDLSPLVTGAPPTGWVCKATHADATRGSSQVFASIVATIFGGGLESARSRDKDLTRRADPHYELADGSAVFYAFNPCRVLSQDCTQRHEELRPSPRSRRGRLFKFKGPVTEGNCLENLLPDPLPVTPWRAELRKLQDQEWLHTFDKPASGHASVPTPEGTVKDPEDARWDPIDVLDPQAGLQANFRFYEPACPAQVVRVNVRIECNLDQRPDMSDADAPFSLCQQLDLCHFEMRMAAKAGCPSGSTNMSRPLPFLFDFDKRANAVPTGDTGTASIVPAKPAQSPEATTLGEKTGVYGQKREAASASSASPEGETRQTKAVPAISVAATQDVLDAARTLNNEFLLQEMRSLASAGFLDASLKQKLAAAPRQELAPAKTPDRQTSVPGHTTSRMTFFSSSSSFASLASSVPQRLRSLLARPVIGGSSGGQNDRPAPFPLLLRVSLCAVIIFVAYWGIRDWITREFAVRGTLENGSTRKSEPSNAGGSLPSLPTEPSPSRVFWAAEKHLPERTGSAEVSAHSAPFGLHTGFCQFVASGIGVARGGYGSCRESDTVPSFSGTPSASQASLPSFAGVPAGTETHSPALSNSVGKGAGGARVAACVVEFTELEMEETRRKEQHKPLVVPLSPSRTLHPGGETGGAETPFSFAADPASHSWEEDWYQQSDARPRSFAAPSVVTLSVENEGSGRTTTAGLSSDSHPDTRLGSSAVPGPSSFFVEEEDAFTEQTSPWSEQILDPSEGDLHAVELGATGRWAERGDSANPL
ncbi:putative transmembrane protein [Toxoplasma gondii RUB]|uniref:Putative transmembrane protein n=1 Tax=Toxoplasma gondii RUB TaxID=935652 RepID=A0A086M5Y7_TOXGO|nr:putative transmembrane protein [Toxoplasma gondii RUB]